MRCDFGPKCLSENFNAAADYTLYFIFQGFPDYVDMPDINQGFLGDTIWVRAKKGKFGSLHSMTRISDWELVLSQEEAMNYLKPVGRKMYSTIMARFGKIELEYADSVIRFLTCHVYGSIRVTAENNLFEMVAATSDKRKCLMDLKLLKVRELGLIDVDIITEEDWLCGPAAEFAMDSFVRIFDKFVKNKLAEMFREFLVKQLPQSDGPLCVAPSFDVVFL